MIPTDPSSNSLSPQAHAGAVVLLSGGLDSAIMAGLAAKQGEPIWPLYVRQGFLWEKEERAVVARFVDSLGEIDGSIVHPLSVATIDVPAPYPSRWALDVGQPAPDETSSAEDVYLPGRNLALLTQAAILAHSVGVGRIQLGILSGNPFADSARSFFEAFETCVREALGRRVRVETPLADWNKSQTLIRGRGFRLEWTLSCIRPTGGIHCGRCNKCAERRRGFQEAGFDDPASYAVNEVK